MPRTSSHARSPVRRLPAGLLALALLLAGTPAAQARDRLPAGGPGVPHPHFDDRGTLAWHASWAEASAAARASGRLVFLDLGREACGGCRVLVEQVLPSAAVRTRLARVAVGWAADADRQEPFVLALRRAHLPHATMLPMLGFVTSEGRWVAGHEGAIGVEGFLGLLARAEAALAAGAVAAPRDTPQALPAPRVRTPGPQGMAAPRRAPASAAQPAPAPAPRQALAPAPLPSPSGPARISGLRLRFAEGARPGDAPLSTERASALPPLRLPPGEPPAAPAPRAAFPAPPPLPPGIAASSTLPLQALPAPGAGDESGAPARLEAALGLALRGQRAQARAQLEALRRAAPATPAGREAQRGLDALGALEDLAQLEASDPARAQALRAARRSALRDTRWAVLF